jgi:uncharacterized protein YndB with AHSA1/START domain
MRTDEGTEPVEDRQIVTTRVIRGPRHLVYRAWTEARHLERWFGPHGFTTTTRSFAFRPGGAWDFVMHGPDGTAYPNWIEWREIMPLERIAYRQGGREGDPDAFEGTVTFADRDGGTEITLRTVFNSKAQRDFVAEHYHAVEGARETLERLDAYVNEPPSSESSSLEEPAAPDASAVSTERVFAADPATIFAAFRQPERLARWWGPSGFTNTFEHFDFTTGGRWVFVMHGPNGASYPNESVFREIQPDARIVIEHVVKPWYRLTVTLTPRGGDTHLAWVQEFESAEVAARIRRLSETANEQNLDRLQSLLAEGSA